MNVKPVFCFDADDFQRVKEIESFWQEKFQIPLVSADDFQNKSPEELSALVKENDIIVVFIGKRTFENEKCLTVIEESFKASSAFLAVYLNNAEDVKKSSKEFLGKNPFDLFYFEHKNGETVLNKGAIVLPGKLKRRFLTKEIKAKPEFIIVYDYIKDNGQENLMRWIEEEQKRKTDFWAECDKISENEWPEVLKMINQSNIAGMFLYYDWMKKRKAKE